MMIENYPNERKMNCETGVMVNMLEYYGIKFSEPMTFGIGGGMCFLYFPWMKMNGYDMLILRTRPFSVVSHFSQRMHLGFHMETFGNDRDKAQKALDDLVAQNIPVGVVVNLMGLPFLADIGIRLDFNGHNLTVIGKEGRDYVLVETHEMRTTDDYPRLDEAKLTDARFRPGFATPHGKLFYLDPLQAEIVEKTDLRPAIIEGMKETCHNMLAIPLRWFGCKGIHTFAKAVRRFDKKLSQEQINKMFFWYYTMIEQGGTGGAGYRYMYSSFLKEAAPLLQSDVIDECAATIGKAADCWRKFTIGCNRYIKNANITLNEMADAIDEAGQYEYDTFINIKKYLKTVKKIKS